MAASHFHFLGTLNFCKIFNGQGAKCPIFMCYMEGLIFQYVNCKHFVNISESWGTKPLFWGGI